MPQEVVREHGKPHTLLLVVILLERVTWLLQMGEVAAVALVKMGVMGA